MKFIIRSVITIAEFFASLANKKLFSSANNFSNTTNCSGSFI